VNYSLRIDIKQPTLHRFGLFYNLHLIYMQVCETLLSKKWHTVMWHRECKQSIHVHVAWIWGEVLAKTFLSRPRPRPRPRPYHI